MARRLSGTVFINGTDDENWPFSDETVHTQHPVQMILDVGQPAAKLQIPPVRWGGECRVELDLEARVIGTGEVQLEGQAKLFEGDSENTQDLEETKSVVFIIPKGGITAHHPVSLSNAGLGGGDHAEISLSFTNSIVE